MKKLLHAWRWEHARAILALLAIAGLTAEALYALKSPAVNLLPPRPDGEWIRTNDPADLHPHNTPFDLTRFRKRFSVAAPQRDVVVAVTAFRVLNAASLDGQPLSFRNPSSWKDPVHLLLPGRLLSPGTHELELTVANRLAPSLIHVSSPLANLGNAEGWEESTREGIEWRAAVRARNPREPAVRESFPSVPDALRNTAPYILPLVIAMIALSVFRPEMARRLTAPESVRNVLIGLLLILGANNIRKLGTTILETGFDTKEHLAYIAYILENHRIPLASDGWQMFQPPLYYAVSAILLLLLQPLVTARYGYLVLWAVPFCCLLLLVEITYRFLRELFPGRKDQQAVGLVVGGLLPMNLYMCQFPGNEPLTAVFTALLLFLTVKYLRGGGSPRTRDTILLGFVAGVAILSKVTPLILIPVICVFMMSVLSGGRHGTRPAMRSAGIFLLVAFFVSGWFFARNWIELGKPFFGGWDPLRKIVWWQEPGYRMAKDYYVFGEVFRQPVYAAFRGFADALYSTFWGDGYNICEHLVTIPELPHWNYVPLAAGIGYSVVPASMMAIGAATAFWKAGEKGRWPFTFLLVSIGVYFAALVHLYTIVPTFSTVKASYAMGLTPCYAAMAALGSEPLLGNKHICLLAVSLLAGWGMMTYAGFFIL